MKINQAMDVFMKAELLKQMIEQAIGTISGDDLLTLACHLDHFWLNRRKEPLTEKEMMVYELLNKERINPSTAYSWLLASRAPNDVRRRYELGRIQSRQLVLFGRNEVEKAKCRKSLQLIRELRDLAEVTLR